MKRKIVVLVLLFSSQLFLITGLRTCDPKITVGFPAVMLEVQSSSVTQGGQAIPFSMGKLNELALLINAVFAGLIAALLMRGLWHSWGQSRLAFRLGCYFVFYAVLWNTLLRGSMLLFLEIQPSIGQWIGNNLGAVDPIFFLIMCLFYVYNDWLGLQVPSWDSSTVGFFPRFYPDGEDLIYRILFLLSLLVLFGVGWLLGSIFSKRVD